MAVVAVRPTSVTGTTRGAPDGAAPTPGASGAAVCPGRRAERCEAHLEARRHGLAPDERLVVPGADDRGAAYRARAGLVRLPDPPDAVFAASGRAAVSVLWAVRDVGDRVPDDVAVLGGGISRRESSPGRPWARWASRT